MKKRYIILISAVLVTAIAAFPLLYRYNYVPHKKFDSEHFEITEYKSPNDADCDGIDDQTDILKSALSYLDTEPKYKSRYYADTGYPNDGYGVCTDVVAFALRDAGYDLMVLVDEDISLSPESYDIDAPDKYIDFRRVKNLSVYFERNAESLTTDTSRIEEWQAGDIVIWEGHIGILSSNRNRKGIPFVLHNANPYQASYEEDILTSYGEIKGHYRIN